MRQSQIFALAGLGLALMGCAGTPIVGPTTIQPSYGPHILGEAAAYGAVSTEIVGQPFDSDRERLGQAVTEALAGSHFGPRLEFTTQRSSRSPYRVVVLFNPARDARPERLCQDPRQPTARRAEEVSVLMAFCRSATPITSTRARGVSATGLEDPAFKRLLRSAGVLLFPPGRLDQGDNSFKG